MEIKFGGLVTKQVMTAMAAALMLLVGCSDTPPDRSAATISDIMQADRDFAFLAERETVTWAFRQTLCDDAVMLPDGAGPLRGDTLDTALNAMDFNLEWEPQQGWAGASGDFGLTWGYWTLRAIDPEGNPHIRHGKYSTAWQKNREGEWCVVMDIGNRGPEPENRK